MTQRTDLGVNGLTYWKDPIVLAIFGYSYRANRLTSSSDALSETLKISASSRNRKFSVGTKPSCFQTKFFFNWIQ